MRQMKRIRPGIAILPALLIFQQFQKIKIRQVWVLVMAYKLFAASYYPVVFQLNRQAEQL